MDLFQKKYQLPLICALVICNLFGCESSDSSSADDSVVLSDRYYSDIYAWNKTGGLQQTRLGRGINLGNYLEAPVEGDWTGGRLLMEEDLQRIAAAGFKTVRVPVRWSAHTALDFPYRIDPLMIDRVREIIGWAKAEHLKVILNVHHYIEMMNAPESQQEAHIQRLLSIWKQISSEFPLSEYSHENLIFELLNEPNSSIDDSDWNNIIARLLTVIWGDMASQQNNETQQRTVMIGTANGGHPDGLANLSLPDSVNQTNTIITVHYYEPFHFTHQGADWVDDSSDWIGTPWQGTSSQQIPLIKLFDRVTHWNEQADHGFEIFMGEFGVYSLNAKPTHQKAWTAFIAREAEKRNISWAYWEYSAGFGAYNADTGQWKPQLIEALIPIE